ncbi:MAG: hypothetical protein U7127_21785 [Phormidium sp.]
MPNPTDEMNDILKSFTELGGVDVVFLLNEATIQSSYPLESDFDFIGIETAEAIGKFDAKAQYAGVSLAAQEMELVTQEKRVLTLKISDESGYVLCVVCPKSTRPDLIKSRFKNIAKEQIMAAIKKSTKIKKE